jgi:hypothetical protein
MFVTCWALWMIAAYTLVPAAHAFYRGTWPFPAIPDTDTDTDTEPVIPAYVPIQDRTIVLSDADMKAFPTFAVRRG